jgi:hypothetical protein
MPKTEARFFPAIWLGKDTSTSENISGISGKIVRARTIRRQIKAAKYDNEMMDVINNSGMTAIPTAAFVPLPAPKTQARRPQTTTTETQTQQMAYPPAAQQTRTHTHQPQPAITDLPMATAPSTQPYRITSFTNEEVSQMTSLKAVHQSNSGRQNNKQHRSNLRKLQNHQQRE